MFNLKANLVKSSKLGIDSRVDEILNNPEGELATKFAESKAFNASQIKKSYLEAALFCENDFEKISQLLEIPTDKIALYAEFFFDVKGLDRLSKVEHMDGIKNPQERDLKLWAMSLGLDFLAWRLGYRVKLGPVEGLHELFATCVYKAKEAMFTPSSSEASKEAVKWTKISTDIGRLIKAWVMDSGAARQDLELAIRDVVPEFEGLDKILTVEQLLEVNELLNPTGIDDKKKQDD